MTPRARAAGRLVLLLAVVAVSGSWLTRSLGAPEDVTALLAATRDSWWAPALFFAGYAVLTTLDFSGAALTAAGGVVFGFGWGALLNTAGANLGATGAFLLARWLGRDGARSLAGERIGALDRYLVGAGFVWLLRLRLIPAVPFSLLIMAAGLTTLPWRTFAVATALGILPGTLVYTWFGDALASGVQEASRTAFIQAAVAGGVLVLLTFAPALWRRIASA
ncbi:MAG: TVP38/TMEM64 family protein [Gemmatimonadetes bacterium]|nr:TVP38/TMEM64 family protein [Gemmatimonadota bacterium]